MKRLLVVCGGEHQIPIVKKVKELGYEVINSNLYKNSPAFVYADYTEVIDVLDYKTNYECAKRYHVDGVIAEQNELSIYTVAYVSEKLGLPSISTKLANLFTNKYLMREFCKNHNFLYPKYKKCGNEREAIDFFTLVGGKMIMKPLDSYSSKGVFEITNIKDCIEYYPISSEFSKNKRDVILEEYIEGVEFTVDGIAIEGRHFTLAISQKTHYEYNKNIACSLYFSYYNPNYDYDLLRETNNLLIEKSGLKLGLTHCEYKYYNGKYYLIEMAARGGGNYIASKIVPVLSGVDNYKAYIQSSVKECPSGTEEEIIKKVNENKDKEAALQFFNIDTDGKKVKKILGIEKIKNMRGIIDVKLNFSEGDIVKKAYDDGSRPGYFIAVGNNKKDLQNTIKHVLESMKIEVE